MPKSRSESLSRLWIAADKNQANIRLVRELQNSVLSYTKASNVQSKSGPKTSDFWQARDQLMSITATLRANQAFGEATEFLDFIDAQIVPQAEQA
jgi:hypothetical protein